MSTKVAKFQFSCLKVPPIHASKHIHAHSHTWNWFLFETIDDWDTFVLCLQQIARKVFWLQWIYRIRYRVRYKVRYRVMVDLLISVKNQNHEPNDKFIEWKIDFPYHNFFFHEIIERKEKKRKQIHTNPCAAMWVKLILFFSFLLENFKSSCLNVDDGVTTELNDLIRSNMTLRKFFFLYLLHKLEMSFRIFTK